jgi:hypothetical protein
MPRIPVETGHVLSKVMLERMPRMVFGPALQVLFSKLITRDFHGLPALL